MAEVTVIKRACAISPLKSSTPLGAALAYLGVEGAVPLFHGSQGCTSFALVLAVRHFKEAIPLQTTAMNEAATVLGGAENLEQALVNVAERMKPKFIGVASTALVETRGEDFEGELSLIRQRCRQLDGVKIAFASTPDFSGALEEGWAAATCGVVSALVAPAASGAGPAEPVGPGRGSSALVPINLLPGVHQTPADIDALRELCELLGLSPTILPDISRSLDGSVPDEYVATSLGGAPLAAIAQMGHARHTVAIGEHMRAPAALLHQRTSVPYTVLPTVTGLGASDALVRCLMDIGGRQAPPRLQRERSQLLDAMLDCHFWFSGRKVAIASDPDLLLSLAQLFSSLGAEVVVAVASTKGSGSLPAVPCPQVVVGDLQELEDRARVAEVDLLVTHSHGRLAAQRLDVPLFRVGFPIFDRLGVADRMWVGYRGTRRLMYELANIFMAEGHSPQPQDVGAEDPRAEPWEARYGHS